jgi:hypothetical protein
MGLSKIKKIGDVQRPLNQNRNDFTPADEYDASKTISPIGRDPDSAGNIGTAIDMVQRNKLESKNIYTITNQYSVDD